MGDKAVDEIVPELLAELSVNPNSPMLGGLRELLNVRNTVVLDVLLPQLLHVPISEFHARTLSALIPVAGPALYKHLPKIISAFLSTFEHGYDYWLSEPVLEAMQRTIHATDSGEGVRHLINHLTLSLRDKHPPVRKGASYLLQLLCQNASLDLSPYIPLLMHALLKLYYDESIDVVEHGIQTLDILVKSLKKDELVLYSSDLGQALRSSIEDCKQKKIEVLPGLTSAKVRGHSDSEFNRV
jgi:hypothetical protein